MIAQSALRGMAYPANITEVVIAGHDGDDARPYQEKACWITSRRLSREDKHE
jgi:hypothetical protein